MSREKVNIDKIKEAIEIAGGMGPLSEKGKISYQAISNWKTGKKSPSSESCRKIEKVTQGKVKAKDILPYYPWDDFE
jgi:DNA-binding transcriptional regulator YdaS (Cro superfamily)